MKKHLVIISIYYPPIASIASNRLYSFAKYIDKEKFDISVITLDTHEPVLEELEGVEVFRLLDTTRLQPIVISKKSNKIVHYAKVLYNKTLVFFRNRQYPAWSKQAEKTVQNLIESRGVDLMLSSFSPVDTHLVALNIKKRSPDIKWIADMRDEMSKNPYLTQRQKHFYERVEIEILKNADAITSVSSPILEDFAQMYKRSIPFVEIRNGYDFELENRYKRDERFTLRYIGNFYGERNPKLFLEALTQLFKEQRIDVFQIEFIGVKTHFKIDDAIKDHIDVIGNVSHEKAIELMQTSDALLLIHPNNGLKGVFTGKLFEYMAALRPIIALIDTQDVAARLIEQSSTGYFCESNDLEAIKQVIMQAYDSWKNETVLPYDKEIIKMHHRKEQAKRLEKLVNELVR